MEEKIINASNEVFNKIKELPQGSEFRFDEYITDYGFTFDENFELLKAVLELCESNNVLIENTQKDQILGMPWVYTYRKNN